MRAKRTQTSEESISIQQELNSLPVNLYRTADRVVVAVPMPGLQPEDVTIDVTDTGCLVLQGRLRGALRDVALPGVASYGWEENTQLFASGQVAMNKDWGPATFKDPKLSKVKERFNAAPLPSGPRSTRTTGVCHG